MKYNRLGNTEISFSAVGLGGWSFGGGKDWGDTPQADVLSTVSAALEAGINWVDTAPIYGDSEEKLAPALKGRRTRLFLATKCGLIKNGSWTDHDLSPKTIVRQLEDSLSRLKTDYIDLYQIHYLDPKNPLEAALETLTKLQKQGKIRYIGVCNFLADDLRQACGTFPLASVQNEYSLLHPQKGKSVFSVCREWGIGFIGYGTLCGGILSGKYKKAPNFRRADARNYFYKCYRGPAFEEANKTVLRVKNVAQELGVPPGAVAAAWALTTGATSVLLGARKPEQVRQNVLGAEVLLSAQQLLYLEGKPCTCLMK